LCSQGENYFFLPWCWLGASLKYWLAITFNKSALVMFPSLSMS
jgi:hypothetical protein